jgi:hypothetical protein
MPANFGPNAYSGRVAVLAGPLPPLGNNVQLLAVVELRSAGEGGYQEDR